MALKFNEIMVGLLPIKCIINESIFPHAQIYTAMDCAECKRLGLKCDKQAPCSGCVERSRVDDCIYPTVASEKSSTQPSPNCQLPTGDFTENYVKRVLLDLGLSPDQVGEFVNNGVLPDGFDLTSSISTFMEAGGSSVPSATLMARDDSNSTKVDSPPSKPQNVDPQSASKFSTMLPLLKELVTLADTLGPQALASWPGVGEARELLQGLTALFGGVCIEGSVKSSPPSPLVRPSSSPPKLQVNHHDNHPSLSAIDVPAFDDFSVTWTTDPGYWEVALRDFMHPSPEPSVISEDEDPDEDIDEDDLAGDAESLSDYVPELERLCEEIHKAARTVPYYTLAALRLAQLCRILTNGYRSWEEMHLEQLKTEYIPPWMGRFGVARGLFRRQVQRDLEQVLAFLSALNDQLPALSKAVKQQLVVAFQNASKFLIFPRPFFIYSEGAIEWVDTLQESALRSQGALSETTD